jgi:histidyl-tRNA synthetase
MGSIGGGRYDDLTGILDLKKYERVGISFGLRPHLFGCGRVESFRNRYCNIKSVVY